MRKIDKIIIHATATSQNTTIDNIITYWKTTLNWKSPGYHYIITADGEVIKLASHDSITNGVKGHNSMAINIAYIGGIDKNNSPTDNRTEEQKSSLLDLLFELIDEIPTITSIVGHRDLSIDLDGDGIIEPHEWIKHCPCFNAIGEYVRVFYDVRR